MGVVIEICIKYPGGPTRMTGTDIYMYVCAVQVARALGIALEHFTRLYRIIE